MTDNDKDNTTADEAIKDHLCAVPRDLFQDVAAIATHRSKLIVKYKRKRFSSIFRNKNGYLSAGVAP
jgi:hypothetical protein